MPNRGSPSKTLQSSSKALNNGEKCSIIGMMKIGVYSNVQKDPTGDVKKRVYAAAEENKIAAEDFKAGVHYDFIVSIGGDGTILRVAKSCALSETPILGVNRGTVGFLTEIEPDELSAAMKRFIARDYVLERRALIDAQIRGKHYYALNDAVVQRSGGGRMISMEVRVNGERIDKFACDGYIACTPTGSTAYSLSSGGSVIGPNTPVIALTPISPHTLHARPIVVGSFEKISMKLFGERADVYIDGEKTDELENGDTVEVTGWDRSVSFVRFNNKSFYSRLLSKLNSWSESEN